ncbi:MAG: WYL domain-containing protein [Anaerolineae bacterium]|nr:WYL domain-containing protein [Anaerolineae bacterium]
MGYETDEKMQRMIDLLMSSFPVGMNTRQLADALDTSQQTVRNYLVRLQDKEVPLVEVEEWVFTIDPRDYVRPLRLSLTQAWFLYVLVRRVVRADLNRYSLVNGVLTRLLTSIHGDIAKGITIEAVTKRTDWDDVLETLIEGWHKQQRVRIQYLPLGETVPKNMTVAPWSLEPAVWSDSNYLVAGVAGKDGEKPFMLKLDRIRTAKLLPEWFERPSPEQLLRRLDETWGIWSSEEVVPLVLRFSYRVIDRVRETHWHPSQKLEVQQDGSLIWRAVVSEPREMAPWIRGWGSDVEVIEPGWLREEIASEAERTARLYGRSAAQERRFF